MIQILVLSSLVAISFARPYYGEDRHGLPVPSHCPHGKEWINGICKDIWLDGVTPPSILWDNQNTGFDNIIDNINSPPRCPHGHVHIHGKCRILHEAGKLANAHIVKGLLENVMDEHGRKVHYSPKNIVNLPRHSLIGYQEKGPGNCLQRRNRMLLVFILSSVVAVSFARPNYGESRNIITVPPNCPSGQEWINGMCRDVWRSGVTPPSMLWDNQDLGNVITVPPNCPPGQEYINGQCRDVWRNGGSLANSNLFNALLKKWSEHVRKAQQSYGSGSTRNIINVPNQCPIGFLPDALGNCRPIL
nr:uncharacterized protein LOC116767295 [Danaus plexippus plexippus]